MTYAIVGLPPNVTVTITNASTGTFTYRPRSNFNGTDTFTYRASDGSLNSNTATVTIIVNPVNDAPVGFPFDQSATTNEDTPVSGTVTGRDFDNDPLTFKRVTAPAHGTVVIDGNAGGDLRAIPGTYTHPDGPPQAMVLTRQ